MATYNHSHNIHTSHFATPSPGVDREQSGQPHHTSGATKYGLADLFQSKAPLLVYPYPFMVDCSLPGTCLDPSITGSWQMRRALGSPPHPSEAHMPMVPTRCAHTSPPLEIVAASLIMHSPLTFSIWLYHAQSVCSAPPSFLFHSVPSSHSPSIPGVAFLSTSFLSHQIPPSS